ncbi:STAS domain-containing protein [Dactylosporangium sp. CA-139066]|uniref:STAS domain-containing protein n=1 Tax=Dactylosporangium sp. CA-139066 TaxID=3239930 RepID=UPI003D8A4B8D
MGTETRFRLGAAVTRADIPVLCDDLARLLRGTGPGVVHCDVAAVAHPDAVTVEALARLHLTARRHGRRLVITGAGPHLRQLITLIGLDATLLECP